MEEAILSTSFYCDFMRLSHANFLILPVSKKREAHRSPKVSKQTMRLKRIINE